MRKVKRFFGKIKKLFKKSSSKFATEPTTKQVDVHTNSGNLLTVSTKINSRRLLTPKPILISLGINFFPKISPLKQICMLFSTEALIISALATIAKAKHYEVAFGQKTLGVAKTATSTERLELVEKATDVEPFLAAKQDATTKVCQIATANESTQCVANTQLCQTVSNTEISEVACNINSSELASCTNSSEVASRIETSQGAATNSSELAINADASQLAPTTERKSNRQRKNRTNRRMTLAVQPNLSILLQNK